MLLIDEVKGKRNVTIIIKTFPLETTYLTMGKTCFN